MKPYCLLTNSLNSSASSPFSRILLRVESAGNRARWRLKFWVKVGYPITVQWLSWTFQKKSLLVGGVRGPEGGRKYICLIVALFGPRWFVGFTDFFPRLPHHGGYLGLFRGNLRGLYWFFFSFSIFKQCPSISFLVTIMGVGEGTYGMYAYVPDVGLAFLWKGFIFYFKKMNNWKTLYFTTQ